MLTGSVADLPGISAAYVAGDCTLPIPVQAATAFEKLEAELDSLRGRKFYGVVMAGEYRACIATQPGEPDNPFPEFRIPCGRYFCHRVQDFLSEDDTISGLVEQMIRRSDFDASRPVVEFYRGHNQLSLRVPVKWSHSSRICVRIHPFSIVDMGLLQFGLF